MVGGGLFAGQARTAVPRPHEWLLILLGTVLVVRYRWLLDDAFVYFRYVDNLLFLRVGLVFNAGEFVEGFSSPLQCVALIPLRALGLDWAHIITALGVTCFVLFGLLLVKLNREMAPSGPIFNLPIAVLATGYGTTSFFTSGLETPLAHVVAVATALWLVRPRGVLLTALVAVAPLARPELALAVALAIGFGWWRSRRFPWLLFGLAFLANGVWLAFRVYYYADLLPNTFYLKDDSQWGLGLEYVRDLLHGVPLVPIAIALVVLRLAARRVGVERLDASPATAMRGGSDAPRLAMLVIGAAVCAYVVRVGGAALHYWYLAFPYTLCVCASAGLVESYLNPLLRRTRWSSAVWTGAGAVAVALFVAADTPRQLSSHPLFATEQGERIGMVADAAYHRHHPRLQPRSWRGHVRTADMRALAPDLARRGYRRVVTGTMCRQHWAQFDARVVHGFGLTEPILARVVTPELIPGHKPGLKRLAEDLARLRGAGVRPGLARDAVERGSAPAWIAQNLETIEVVERKMSNRHDWRENIALATSFPAPIILPR